MAQRLSAVTSSPLLLLPAELRLRMFDMVFQGNTIKLKAKSTSEGLARIALEDRYQILLTCCQSYD